MSVEIKREIQEYCTMCSEELSNLNTVAINEDILMLLKFLIVEAVRKIVSLLNATQIASLTFTLWHRFS